MTTTTRKLLAITILSTSIGTIGCEPDQSAGAQPASGEPAPLSAAASDPGTLGWMTGFPPPPEKLVPAPERMMASATSETSETYEAPRTPRRETDGMRSDLDIGRVHTEQPPCHVAGRRRGPTKTGTWGIDPGRPTGPSGKKVSRQRPGVRIGMLPVRGAGSRG